MAEIIIHSYDPAWPGVFEQERERLLSVLPGLSSSAFHHVGSTSVPGLGAKPIVDILLAYPPDADRAASIGPIQSLGYDYIARYERQADGMPFRRFFSKRGPGSYGSFNLHAVYAGANFARRHLGFRDHLRAHPEVAAAYEALKRELAPRFSDVNDYAKAKTEFIERVLAGLALEPVVHRVRPDDWQLLREARLRALADSPSAFGSRLEDAAALADEAWQAMAASRSSGAAAATFLAEDNAGLCGLAGGWRASDSPQRATLVSMWVAPEWRRRGVGRQLIGAVQSWARDAGCQELSLWVTQGNAPAVTLYRSMGFAPSGETEALRSNPRLKLAEYRLGLLRQLAARSGHDVERRA